MNILREDSVLKKSLFFGIAAIFAAIMFTACPTEAEIEYRDKIEYRDRDVTRDVLVHADRSANDPSSLMAALEDPDSRVIALLGNVNLPGDLEIPAGKTLILYAGLNTNSQELEVKGTVIVAVDGGLTASSAGVVTVTGKVEVYLGGVIDLDDPDSLTGLGTGKVDFKGGTLKASWPTDLETITTALGYVTYGALDISGATHSLKLSELAAISGIGETHGLMAVAGADEDATSLNIPLGVVLAANASDDLDTVTSLTVNGLLYAPDAVGPSDGITITAGPKAYVVTGDIAKLKTSSVAAGGLLTTGDVAAFDTGAVLTAAAGSTVNNIQFPAAAAITALEDDAVTIKGTLSIPGDGVLFLDSDLVLDNNATLVIPEGSAVKGSGSIIAEDGKGTITITGFPGFTTVSTGVDDLWTAAASLQSATVLVTPAISLDATFGTSGVNGIGSVELTTVSATPIRTEGNAAGTGDEITLAAGTTLVSNPVSASAADGTDAGDITVANISLSIDSNKLSITDSDYAGGTEKLAVVTFEDVQLQSAGGLISPKATFNVGIKTSR
jgi:hypothetical protein